ncbi:MFS transporter [Lapillicoccus jejuensis]|uniref:Putative MFS family arabinose efflux permease n=1 Tax=Lapillicoccus jejuensis TaxID=402171 RepID=A0A542E0U5_9MICO|nr:MFS transporter [Lapillicoccus jejuensis]TQJ08963.1 putative MFS family arabinose efflux permease [Lapillicoccus jejuensis]
MSPTFASLSIRNYRIYATGSLVSNVGTWMGRVGQDWLVLTVLTNHSSTALGFVTGLQFLPFLLLAPFTGAIADRFPKRRILFCSQSALALSALVLATLTLTGVVQLWHVYAVALFQGVATAVDNPARQTFVSEMVPRQQLSNAVGLNSASFNAGRLLGPGIAGLVIAGVGTGLALLLNGLSFFFVLASLASMHTDELNPVPTSRGRGQVREGFAYVRSRPDLMLLMGLVFVLGTFGMNFQITTALMATQAFHKGPTEYGLLGSIMAIGSLAAALLAARRKNPRLLVVVVALAGFTVATAVASIAPTYDLFALSLVPVGLFALTAMNTANSTVQLSVDPQVRGRVMSLYMAILMGGTPIGSPLIGWIGDHAGPRWTIGVGSIAVGLSLAVVAVVFLRSGRVRIAVERADTARLPRLRLVRRPVTAPVIPEPEAVR